MRSRLRSGPSFRRRVVLLCGCFLIALASTDCTRWRAQPAADVSGLADPDRSYQVVLDTLKAKHYRILDQDASARVVRVRAHAGSNEEDSLSVVQVRVDGHRVHVSASGKLVLRDGRTHRSLNAELSTLDKNLKQALASAAQTSAPSAGSSASSGSSSTLPAAWSEPAYDPAVWGHGTFTCLPVKLAEREQADLTLKLSSGENADVQLSLAQAPELCRSPSQCKLAGGCPALGMGDAEHVSRLAARLSKHEIGPLATLCVHGEPVATIDLSKHGSIAQALTEVH